MGSAVSNFFESLNNEEAKLVCSKAFACSCVSDLSRLFVTLKSLTFDARSIHFHLGFPLEFL